MQFAIFDDNGYTGAFVISKEYITGTFTILNKETYYVIYYNDYNYGIAEFNTIDNIAISSFMEFPYEDRIILEIINPNDLIFDISF